MLDAIVAAAGGEAGSLFNALRTPVLGNADKIVQKVVSANLMAEHAASALIGLATKYAAGNPAVTVLDYLRSPSFGFALDGNSQPDVVQIQCYHCHEFIFVPTAAPTNQEEQL